MPPRRGQPSRGENFKEALTYLNQLKKALKEDEEKYSMVLDILANYRARGISVDVAKTQVRELFGDRQELILGFNAFLAKGSEIMTTDDTVENRIRTTEFHWLHSFLRKLKERFEDDDHVFKSFMGILNVYMIEHRDITKAQHEVGALLEGHPDLVEEFTRISADNAATTSTTKTLSDKEADFKKFASVLSETGAGRIKGYP